jgi:hypothetical protein
MSFRNAREWVVVALVMFGGRCGESPCGDSDVEPSSGISGGNRLRLFI